MYDSLHVCIEKHFQMRETVNVTASASKHQTRVYFTSTGSRITTQPEYQNIILYVYNHPSYKCSISRVCPDKIT